MSNELPPGKWATYYYQIPRSDVPGCLADTSGEYVSVMRKRRTPDKRFSTWHRDPAIVALGADTWDKFIGPWSDYGLLYRRQELDAALAAGETVCCVEGEKDADTGARLGLVATTHYQGGADWNPKQAEAFRGFRGSVRIVFDRDPTGARIAWRTAERLEAVGVAPERISFHCPHKRHGPRSDLSDVVAAGGGLSDLVEVPRERLRAHIKRIGELKAGSGGYGYGRGREFAEAIREAGGWHPIRVGWTPAPLDALLIRLKEPVSERAYPRGEACPFPRYSLRRSGRHRSSRVDCGHWACDYCARKKVVALCLDLVDLVAAGALDLVHEITVSDKWRDAATRALRAKRGGPKGEYLMISHGGGYLIIADRAVRGVYFGRSAPPVPGLEHVEGLPERLDALEIARRDWSAGWQERNRPMTLERRSVVLSEQARLAQLRGEDPEIYHRRFGSERERDEVLKAAGVDLGSGWVEDPEAVKDALERLERRSDWKPRRG